MTNQANHEGVLDDVTRRYLTTCDEKLELQQYAERLEQVLELLARDESVLVKTNLPNDGHNKPYINLSVEFGQIEIEATMYRPPEDAPPPKLANADWFNIDMDSFISILKKAKHAEIA